MRGGDEAQGGCPWSGVAPPRWEDEGRQPPSPAEAHGAGRVRAQERGCCVRTGKGGLTYATSSHIVSTASLTILLGCDGKKSGALGMCAHEKRTFYLFLQECFKKKYS